MVVGSEVLSWRVCSSQVCEGAVVVGVCGVGPTVGVVFDVTGFCTGARVGFFCLFVVYFFWAVVGAVGLVFECVERVGFVVLGV